VRCSLSVHKGHTQTCADLWCVCVIMFPCTWKEDTRSYKLISSLSLCSNEARANKSAPNIDSGFPNQTKKALLWHARYELTCAHTHSHTWAHIRTRTHTHTHARTHTHTQSTHTHKAHTRTHVDAVVCTQGALVSRRHCLVLPRDSCLQHWLWTHGPGGLLSDIIATCLLLIGVETRGHG